MNPDTVLLTLYKINKIQKVIKTNTSTVFAQLYKSRQCLDDVHDYYKDIYQIWIPSAKLTVHKYYDRLIVLRHEKSQAGQPYAKITINIDSNHSEYQKSLAMKEYRERQSRVEPETQDIYLPQSLVDDLVKLKNAEDVVASMSSDISSNVNLKCINKKCK
jgi:hypothetical protein